MMVVFDDCHFCFVMANGRHLRRRMVDSLETSVMFQDEWMFSCTMIVGDWQDSWHFLGSFGSTRLLTNSG